jgi:hypothetical protein
MKTAEYKSLAPEFSDSTHYQDSRAILSGLRCMLRRDKRRLLTHAGKSANVF